MLSPTIMFSQISHFGLLQHLFNLVRFETRQAKESAQALWRLALHIAWGGFLVSLAASRHVLAEVSLVNSIGAEVWCLGMCLSFAPLGKRVYRVNIDFKNAFNAMSQAALW